MTPVTPVPSLSDTNNNTSIEEELAWSQTDNDEDDHVFAHVTITILGLKSYDVSNFDDWMKYLDTHLSKISSVSTSQALMTFSFTSTTIKMKRPLHCPTCCHVTPSICWMDG